MADAITKFQPDVVAEICESLTQALAETAVTTVKAQNFHWNVTGMAFGPLHALFQQIYEDHFTAQDDIAERVKALGGHAEGRFAEYLKRASVRESDGKLADTAMVQELANDQETISATLRALAALADGHGDLVTNDLAIGRAHTHDKFAWLLRAHLG